MVFGSTCHRIDKFGHDPTGLGRWAWVRLRGKDGTHQRIISAYRPVYNTMDDNSTYVQQQLLLSKNLDHEICPRQKFVEDLANKIARFRDDGDEIHLALDYNDDLRKSNALASALGELDIREAILDQHGRQGPTAHPSAKNHGRKHQATFTTTV